MRYCVWCWPDDSVDHEVEAVGFCVIRNDAMPEHQWDNVEHERGKVITHGRGNQRDHTNRDVKVIGGRYLVDMRIVSDAVRIGIQEYHGVLGMIERRPKGTTARPTDTYHRWLRRVVLYPTIHNRRMEIILAPSEMWVIRIVPDRTVVSCEEGAGSLISIGNDR